MRVRYLALVVLVLAASCVVPGGALATRYKLDGPRAISGPSPFAAGCPGARLDATAIAGHELETAITVNPRTRATSSRPGSRTSVRVRLAAISWRPRWTAARRGRAP
jgi:hypothetical protein